jgi:phage baseplate assembly protein gpV
MADNRSALHQGQTTERDVKSASARVGFDDLAGTVSGFMQVLFPAAGGWNFFYTPKEGDQVVVSRLPNGAEEGYILGKVYTAGKMPQGGADNIILIVSDDGKNLVRFDADKGTLDLTVDQNGTLKFKNLEISVKNNTHLATDDLDIESKEPIGFSGTKTQLGADVLQVFFDDLKAAIQRNPVVIPPSSWPKGAPVPPAPPIINMFLNGLIEDIAAAIEKAKESCKKALK